MKFNIFLAIFLSLIVLFACNNDDEPGKAEVRLTIGAERAVSGLNQGRVAEHIEITGAWIGIEKIELESEDETDDMNDDSENGDDENGEDNGDDDGDDGDDDDGDDDENEYNFTGPYIIDLLGGTSDPELPLAEIAPGTYHEAEAELIPVVEDSLSVLIQGNYGDTPFMFLWENTEDFEVESETGFELSADMLYDLLITIDLHALFDGIDFDQALINVDGEIIFSKDSNRDLADIIEENIESASEIEME